MPELALAPGDSLMPQPAFLAQVQCLSKSGQAQTNANYFTFTVAFKMTPLKELRSSTVQWLRDLSNAYKYEQ